MEKQKPKKRSIAIMEVLEPRVLFSADLFGGLIDSPVANDPLTTLLDDTAALFEAQAIQAQHEQTDSSEPEPQSEDESEDANTLLTTESVRKELVFIDPATPEYQQILDDRLVQADDNRQIDVVLLDANRDGFTQISEIMADYSDLDAVHLISHASDGVVSLGSSSLDFESLNNNSAEIQDWGNAFAESGDLLIYGCNLASSAEGELLVESIAQLTGADVAASEDLTGHASLGGDWELEYQAGVIDAQVAVSQQTQTTWMATLVAPVLSGAIDLTAIDEDPASNTGTLVSDLITEQIIDPDGPSSGIAVIAVDDTHGTWEYNTGSGWVAFGAVDIANTRLLAADASVRFVPDADWNGTVTDGIAFHAWDQGSGVNGGTADLSATHTVLDDFDSDSGFSGINDGTMEWSGDWQELGESDGPTSGVVSMESIIYPDSLRFGSSTNMDITGYGVQRQVDLTDAASATLTLDVWRFLLNDSVGTVTLEISDDGINWTNLDTFQFNTLPFSPDPNPDPYDISAYASATTSVRLLGSGEVEFDFLYIDNIQITLDAIGGSTAFSAATASSNITVTSVNDSPTVSLTNQVNNLAEDSDTSTAIRIADIVITDDGLGTNDLTLVGVDAASFEIVGSELRLRAGTALDFEAQDSFDVTVQVDDSNVGATPDDSVAHSLSITDVNEVPSVSLTNRINYLAEDTDTSDAVRIADIVIADDGLGTNDLTLVGVDAASFEIVGSELRLRAGTALDIETQASFDVTLQVDDSSVGGTPDDSVAHSLGITDVNERPDFTSTAVTSVTEDGSYSYNITTTDPDNNASLVISSSSQPTWLTLNDNGNGTANLSGTPSDTEVGDHNVVLEISDGNLTNTQSFNITVNNTNDAPFGAPTIIGAATENQMLSTDTSGISDADGLGAYSYQWLQDDVAILNATNNSYILGDADVGTQISVEVSYTDGHGSTERVSSAQTSTITNINDDPVITSDGGDATASIHLAENQSGVTTVTAIDVDTGDSLKYGISGGSDQGMFSIDANSGALVFNTAPNFEASSDADGNGIYEVQVNSVDEHGGTDVQQLSVIVNNVNEAGVGAISDNNGNVDHVIENSGNGAFVGITVAAADPDGTDTITYSLDDNAGGRFIIDEVTGVVTVNGALNYETATAHGITVRATSTDGSFATRGFTINIEDMDEPVIPPIPDDIFPVTQEPNRNPDNSILVNNHDDETTVEEEAIIEEDSTQEILTETTSDNDEAPVDTESSIGFAAMTGEMVELLPMDSAELPSVVADVQRDLDHFEDQSTVYNTIPPKSINLRFLDIAPFELVAKEPVQIRSPMDNNSFIEGLEAMKRDLNKLVADDNAHYRLGAETAIGVTMSLSAGIVSWVLRTGSLMASFMSIVPLWKQLDPLPVFDSTLGKKRNDQVKPTNAENETADVRVEELFEQEGSN